LNQYVNIYAYIRAIVIGQKYSTMNKDICVITFTVDRVMLLIRCIHSVRLQGLPVRHLIFSENSDVLQRDTRLKDYLEFVEFHKIEGEPHKGASSPRMAALRQYSLSHVHEKYVCFLDDDNEMEPGHLKSLMAVINEQQLVAAYSWRLLLHADGTHFDGSSYPWHHDPAEAHIRWKWCIDAGVMIQGQPVMRDGPVTVPDPLRLATVDMNEWLFKTEELKLIGLLAEFTDKEVESRMGEDDKLFGRIQMMGLPIAGTGLATIRYYLGGVSNYCIN